MVSIEAARRLTTMSIFAVCLSHPRTCSKVVGGGSKGGGLSDSMESYYGFLYTVLGVGASHMGLQRGPEEKACRGQPMGPSLRPNKGDHWPQPTRQAQNTQNLM